MKITKIEAIPVAQQQGIQLINDSAQDGIIVKVHTDEGIVGYGEVDSAPWVVKSIIERPPMSPAFLTVTSFLPEKSVTGFPLRFQSREISPEIGVFADI